MSRERIIDNPELMKWWDTEENTKEGLDPAKLTVCSIKEAHFICPNGHRFIKK